jgi:TonB family protein
MAVGDQLKLASDTIRPAGERTASTAKPSLYDPPEAKSGRGSTAGDIWGLGITLVEALTQSPPAWSRESSENVSLPANLAPEFLDTVQRCLSLDPGRRPAIAELVEKFQTAQGAEAAAPPAVPPVIHEPWIRTLYTQTSPKARFLITAVTVGLITLWVVWTGIHLYETHAAVRQSASITPPSPSAVSPPAVVESPKANITPPLPTVLHQETPDLSRSARESIRGVVNVAVRVTVDRSGNVVTATLDDRVSNKHFARAALDAAKRWKFAPAADQVSRVWLLHFNFSRTGATADAAIAR